MNFASSTLMPLLARIVIAAAMLTSGWVNCFGQVQIRSEIVDGLRSMDIEVHEPSLEVALPTSSKTEGDAKEPETASTAETVDGAQITPTTRGVHRIVWLIHSKWPDLGGWAKFIAWTAAVAQLIAGVLLLVGLFTRLAALAICIATGMALYLVSANVHGMFTMNPFEWPLDSHRFIQLFAGLGLFTLSLGVFLGGPGGLSIDRRHADGAKVKSNPTKNSTL